MLLVTTKLLEKAGLAELFLFEAKEVGVQCWQIFRKCERVSATHVISFVKLNQPNILKLIPFIWLYGCMLVCFLFCWTYLLSPPYNTITVSPYHLLPGICDPITNAFTYYSLVGKQNYYFFFFPSKGVFANSIVKYKNGNSILSVYFLYV